MPIEREFTGWERVFLPLVLESLHRRFVRRNDWDMGAVVVVLRSSRARTRLLQLAAERAAVDRLLLIPPEIVTPGRLPEALMANTGIQPPPIIDALAWMVAAQSSGEQARIDLEWLSEDSDISDRMLGNLTDDTRALHLELAAAGIPMLEGSRRLLDGGLAVGAARLKALAGMVSEHHRLLESAGYVDREKRRETAAVDGVLRCDRTIVLAGVVELPVTARELLLRSAAPGVALIHASEAEAEGFDELGCIRPEYWLERRNAAGSLRIVTVQRPADQAQALVHLLNGLGARVSPDAITVGMCDERLAPRLRRELAAVAVPCRIAAGTSLSHSTVYSLLRSLMAYLERPSPVTLASLAREPDLTAWLRHIGVLTDENQAIREMDRWITEQAPCALTATADCPTITALLAALDGTLQRLSDAPSAAIIAVELQLVLAKIYAPLAISANAEHARAASMTLTAEMLSTCAGLRAACDLNAAVSAPDLLRLLTGCLAAATTPDELSGAAIELAGWLELHLDDAEVVLLTGVNDAFLPARDPVNPLITGEEAALLGLASARERLARDGYLFAAIRAGRRELAILCSQHGTEEEPLMPSRLLAQCESNVLVERIRAFAELGQTYSFAPPAGVAASASTFLIPRPDRATPPRWAMPVTGFRTYLRCPYRFYLKHVCRLAEQRDDAVELNQAIFGELVHATLAAFGRDASVCDIEDEEAIFHFLQGELGLQLRQAVGERRSVFVEAQHIALENRLRAFSRLQAEHAAEGWRIVATETQLSGVLPGTVTPVTGRIDRIDRRGDEILILDYKTGKLQTPEESHRERQGEQLLWRDLQLPVYILLTHPSVYQARTARAAVICLPEARSKAGLHEARWTADDMASAEETAVNVMRNVEAGIFWPPSREAERFGEFRPVLLNQTRDWLTIHRDSVSAAAAASDVAHA